MESIYQWAMKYALMYLALSALAPQAGAQYREIGLAGFYADYLHGKTTAFGEVYDRGQMTCAHRTHPLGTLLRVTRLETGSSVMVRVNDRGVLSEGFVVSLSRAAADAIGLDWSGKTRVQVELAGQEAGNPLSGSFSSPNTYDNGFTARSPQGVSSPNPLVEKIAEPHAAMPTSRELLPKSGAYGPVPAQVSEYSPVPHAPPTTPPGYDGSASGNMPQQYEVLAAKYPQSSRGKVSRVFPGFGGFGVQTASFSNYENADRLASSLIAMGIPEIFILEAKTDDNVPMYRIIAGNFQTRIEAERYLAQLRDSHKLSGFIVTM